MSEFSFAIPLGIAEIVIPIVSVGVFLPGFFLFGYMMHRSPQPLYERTIVVSAIAFVFVLGEALVIIVGAMLHRQAISAQIARVQQVAGAWMIPAIPYYLGGALETARRVRRMNRIMIISGVVLATGITVVAFAAPDLFRSVTRPHATALEIESTFGRGAQGPLTRYRDLALFLIIIYANALVVLEVISRPVSRFSLTLMTGLLIAFGFAVLSLLNSIVGPFPNLYPRSVVAITVFVLGSTLAATWRFVDQAREVESAHSALKSQEKKLSYLAYHDPLTGVRNRKAFYEVLAGRGTSAQTGAGPEIAVFYIDLDYFKQVNDTYGHRTGDMLLRKAAEELKAAIRQSDALFRIGGDEFALIVETAPGREELRMIADKLLSRFKGPLAVGGREFSVGISVGAALMPSHATSVEDLVSKADRALYVAKQERGTFRLYGDGPDTVSRAPLELLDQFRDAVQRDDFAMHYQRVVRGDGSTVGVEALLRWQPRGGRPVPPDAIIDLADAAGLMGVIGDAIFDRVLREVAEPLAAGRVEYVSVNLSARQVIDPAFSRRVTDAARRYGVPPARIRLETKESMVLYRAARGLRGGGEPLRLTIDDFGFGSSTFSFVRELATESVKLDRDVCRALGADPAASAFVRGLLTMTGDLGIEVIGKGVETEDQRDAFLDAGCRFLQGFFFGEPGPLDVVLP